MFVWSEVVRMFQSKVHAEFQGNSDVGAIEYQFSFFMKFCLVWLTEGVMWESEKLFRISMLSGKAGYSRRMCAEHGLFSLPPSSVERPAERSAPHGTVRTVCASVRELGAQSSTRLRKACASASSCHLEQNCCKDSSISSSAGEGSTENPLSSQSFQR